MTTIPGTNTGHGHVYRRPDGVKVRCGGPSICPECAKELAQLCTSLQTPSPDTLSPGCLNSAAPASTLSKREMLAAMALQGLCAAITGYDGPNRVLDMDGIAEDAVSFADALLKELAK